MIPIKPLFKNLDYGVGNAGLFYQTTAIDGDMWNRSFDYVLQILDASTNSPLEEFVLPIPPENLTISTPFAINTSVTLGGIVEEHAGAPLRMITLSGTTGVLPKRDHAPKATNIFAGVIQSGSLSSVNNINLATGSLDSIGKTLRGEALETPNIYSFSELTSPGLFSQTGYFKFRQLQRFLESYVTLKQKGENKNLRLAFKVIKDEAIYIVTPVQFDFTRSISSPREYKYNLVLKGWKRIAGDPVMNQTGFKQEDRLSTLAKVFNTIRESRLVIQRIEAAVKGVRSDVDAIVFEPLRQVSLFLKDSISLAVSIGDMPKSIIDDYNSIVAASWADLSQKTEIKRAISNSPDLATDMKELQTNPEALFKNKAAAALIFDKISIPSLPTPPNLFKKVNDEKNRARALNVVNFRENLANFEAVRDDFATSVGLGDDAYNAIYGTVNVVQKRAATDQDYEVLFHLNSIVTATQDLISAMVETKDSTPTSLEYVAGLAQKSGVAFKVPTAKFSIPMPYGVTLERLALDYLKDPNRWLEIAELNGLKAPYIDEEGFETLLSTNGNKNKVSVSNANNLYVNQAVWILSNTVPATKRYIKRIDKNSFTQYIITLSGDNDLDSYLTADVAKLHTFLPHTVNSQMMVYIPFDGGIPEGSVINKTIPGVNDFDKLINVSGIDILLNSKGDIVVTPDGDSRYAYGLNNVVQFVKLIISTPQGSLIQHPEFGFGIDIGISTADIDAKQILQAAQNAFSGDPMFSGVKAASVVKSGPIVSLSLSVGLAGSQQFIPISVNIS